MFIGIDFRAVSGKGGIAHYTKNLVKNLLLQDNKNHYVLFFDTNVSPKFKIQIEQKNCSIESLPQGRFLPFVHSHLIIGNFFNKRKLDLLHSPTGSLPLGYRGKSVITIHDLAIYKHPEWFPRNQWFSKKIVVPYSIRRADQIIAVSQTTKQDLGEIFSIPRDKVKVIYEAGFSPPKERDQDAVEDYILFIGTLEPRKNLVRLLRAFAWYQREYSNSEKLLIVGGEGWKFEDIHRTVRRLKLEKKIRLAGYVNERKKIRLLKQAKALIFPSLYEGFGLPVLEAMSLGVPVICSNKGALPEIAGKNAYFVDPQDTRSIFKGLVEVLENKNLRKRLAKRGLTQAKAFSWSKCAQETLEIYHSFMA